MNRHLDKLIYRVRLGLVRISQPKLRERDSDGRMLSKKSERLRIMRGEIQKSHGAGAAPKERRSG